MQAFNSDTVLRDTLISLAILHRVEDEYIKGSYYTLRDEKFQACSIGCLIQDMHEMYRVPDYQCSSMGFHGVLEGMLGIHRGVWVITDVLYEELPMELAVAWTERVLKAIKIGADTSNTKATFLAKVEEKVCLHGDIYSVLSHCPEDQVPEIADIFIETLETCA